PHHRYHRCAVSLCLRDRGAGRDAAGDPAHGLRRGRLLPCRGPPRVPARGPRASYRPAARLMASRSGEAPGEGQRLLVVGTGLIGTSVGIAARAAGYDVVLANRDPDRLAVAAELGAGNAWDGVTAVDLAVVALPPVILAAEVDRLRRAGVASTITHVC